MEWLLLSPTQEQLTSAYEASVVNKTEGDADPKTVYNSMLLLQQWFKKAKVEIYYKGIEKLEKKEGVRNIIAPNHPNLFDSLATRLLFYASGKYVPYTAAIDTLANVPGVSSLLKNNGAFFINTKRFNDLAYREQVNDYMKQVTDRGDWLQFYFEGDRMSHERQRVPRRGLLSAVTDKPCLFFPVSVSYEKIPTSYLRKVGRVYVEVHDPIAYHPLSNFDAMVDRLAAQVQKGVNAYTTDVAATLLLHYNGKVELEELQKDCDWLQALLVSRDVPFIEVELEKALSFLDVKVSKGMVTTPKKRERLVYHRERILHCLYDLADPPSFIAKEFAWTPPAPLVHEELASEVAASAITPLLQLYSSVIEELDKEERITMKELEGKVLGSVKDINLEMVRNSLRLLKEQKIVSVNEKGEVVLL